MSLSVSGFQGGCSSSCHHVCMLASEKGRAHSFLLRAWPRKGIITFAHIPLVGIQSHGHTQVQGKLGNVAFSCMAVNPPRTGGFCYLLFKDGNPSIQLAASAKKPCPRNAPSDIHSKYINLFFFFFNLTNLTRGSVVAKKQNRKSGYGLIPEKES